METFGLFGNVRRSSGIDIGSVPTDQFPNSINDNQHDHAKIPKQADGDFRLGLVEGTDDTGIWTLYPQHLIPHHLLNHRSQFHVIPLAAANHTAIYVLLLDVHVWDNYYHTLK